MITDEDKNNDKCMTTETNMDKEYTVGTQGKVRKAQKEESTEHSSISFLHKRLILMSPSEAFLKPLNVSVCSCMPAH